MKSQSGRWDRTKGRIRHFDYHLSLRMKITLILIAIPLVLIPFVTVSLYYNNMSYNTVQGMRGFSEIGRICEAISFLTLRIDGNLNNFAVLRDISNIAAAKTDLTELKELATEGKGIRYPDDFDMMIKNIDRYSILLDSLVLIISKEELPEERIARDLHTYKSRYDSLMSALLLLRKPEERDSLRNELVMLSKSFNVSKILQEKGQNPQRTKIIRLLDSSKKAIDDQNASISSKASKKIKEFTDMAERYASKGSRNIWTVLILTIVFIIYLIVVLPERIAIPIRRISNIIKRIEKGDLNISTKGFPRDELGELVDNIMSMLNQVRKIDGLKTQKIHESERKAKFLLNAISEGVILLSDELRVLSINNPALAMLNLKAQDVEGKSLEAIKSLSTLVSPMKRLFEENEKIEELGFTGTEGLFYQIKVWVIRDAAGKPTDVMLLFVKS